MYQILLKRTIAHLIIVLNIMQFAEYVTFDLSQLGLTRIKLNSQLFYIGIYTYLKDPIACF